MYTILQTRVAKCLTIKSNNIILKEGMMLNLSTVIYAIYKFGGSLGAI